MQPIFRGAAQWRSARSTRIVLSRTALSKQRIPKETLEPGALGRIQALYAIEAEINPAEIRRAERQAGAGPLLEAFRHWAEHERRRISSKIALAKALQHSLSRWDALTRYIGDGRLAIDNNAAERSIRERIFYSWAPTKAVAAQRSSTPLSRLHGSTTSIRRPRWPM
jgi:hypothetical protein